MLPSISKPPITSVVLVFILAFCLYLPALDTGAFIFDDAQMITALRAENYGTLSGVFFSENTRYFRPVLIMSFLLDKYLWNLEPHAMRLMNILIHAFNSVLILLLTHHISMRVRGKSSMTALLLAALFAVHPLQTESVNWISGRTDPLASLFALIGLYCFFKFHNNKSLLSACLSSFFLFVACLVKEVAFGVYLGLIFYILLKKPSQHLLQSEQIASGRKKYEVAPYVFGATSYLILRFFCIRGVDEAINRIAAPVTTDSGPSVFEQIGVAIKALGFYLKKLLIPVPANFAISDVNDVYFWLGLIFLPLFFILIIKRTLPAALVLLTLGTIAPALLNAVYKIAWTPYAERYLYLPVALTMLTVCMYLSTFPSLKKYGIPLLVLLFLFYLPVTLQRNMLWAQPLELLKDSLQQSPKNHSLRNNYAITLAANKRYAEAREEWLSIIKDEPENTRVINNLGYYSEKSGDFEQARVDLDVYYSGTLNPDENILKLMRRINEQRLDRPSNAEPEVIKSELRQIKKRLFRITGEM